MNINELNTNVTSLDRIYIYTEFLTFYFNEQHPEKNADEIKQFIANATLEAENDKYECWRIEPSFDEGDHDTLPSSSLIAMGYRLETDKEYAQRLFSRMCAMKNSHFNWKRQKVYYSDGTYETRIAEIEETLTKLNINI
jgi:hypothetical protein